MRKFILALAVAAMLPVAAFAQTVLEFPTYQLRESFGPWWQQLVAEFEKQNPGVKINLTNAPSNDHHRMLTTRFAAGNPPDIVHMTARFVWGYADEGVLEPLEAWMDKTDIKRSWVPSQASMSVAGKTYGLIMLNYGWGLFYNEAMLRDAKVAVPTTLESLVAAAKALTRDRDGDKRIDQYGMALNTSSSSWGYMTFMHFHAGRDRDLIVNGKLDSVGEIERTLAIIDELVKAGVTPRGIDNNPMRDLFWQGNAAMYIDGSWAPGYADTAAPEVKANWRVAPMPFANIAGGPSNALAMPKDIAPARKELVWKFIALAASPEWQRRYGEISGNPPGRTGMLTDEARRRWPTLPLFEESATRQSRSHLPIGFEKEFNRVADIVTEALTAMVAGNLAPAMAARQIQLAMERDVLRATVRRVDRERLFLAALLLPAVAATAALVAWPVLWAGRISFYQLRLGQLMRPITAAATPENYERALGHPGFVRSLEATAIFVGVGTTLSLVLGLVSALALDRRFTGSAALRTIILSPWAIAPVVASLAWLFMFNESLGLVNYLLLALGLVAEPVPFLTSPAVAIWTVTLAAVWKAYPFFTIVLLAGLQSIPPMLYESAAIDGAGRLRRFRDVTLPGLRPFLLISILLSVLAAYRNVETILVMTGGGPARSTETLAVRVYTETFNVLSPGTGAAIGMVTIAIALLIALPFLRRLGSAER